MIRFSQYIDLFLLKYFGGLETVGIYTFYIGIFRAMQGLVESGTSMILRPHLIEAHKAGDHALFATLQKQCTLGILGSAALVSAIVYFALGPVLTFTDKEAYQQQADILWYFIPALFLSGLSAVPENWLYVRHQDKALFIIQVILLAVFAVALWTLIPAHGLEGAAIAVLILSGMSLVIKTFYSLRTTA